MKNLFLVITFFGLLLNAYSQPLLVSASSDLTICPGTTTTISAFGSGGTGGPYTYTWTNDQDATILTGATQLVSPLVTTIYTVTLTDGVNPAVSDFVVISVYILPPVSYSVDVIVGCEPLMVNFLCTTSVISCSWDFSDGTATGFSVSHSFGTPGCYDISMIGITSDGCLVDTTIFSQICVFANPILSFSITSESGGGGNGSINLTAIGAISFDWNNDGTGDFDDAEDISGLSTGWYVVSAMSSNGCITTDSVYIDYMGINEFQTSNDYFYPNPFSEQLNFTGNVSELSCLQIIDVSGKIVKQFNTGEITKSINLQLLVKGHYTLKAINRNGSYFTKEIIKL